MRRGTKKFRDINEAHPEQTIVKSTESRRVDDDKDIATMSSGKEKEIRPLVAKRALAAITYREPEGFFSYLPEIPSGVAGGLWLRCPQQAHLAVTPAGSGSDAGPGALEHVTAHTMEERA